MLYLGLRGLSVASVWNSLLSRKRKGNEAGPVLQSIITCPKCGHRAEETMPTNACLFFYDWSRCGATLKPKTSDCCVFSSYGSVPCPPKRLDASRCAWAHYFIRSSISFGGD